MSIVLGRLPDLVGQVLEVDHEFVENARYAGQLERYARLLFQQDGRPIRLGLYFPLLSGWLEWPASVLARKQMSLFEL